MSQLERENNKSFGFSKFWNYDSIGNIESVKIYNYTTDSLSGATEAIDYKYSEDSSTGWDRLLTELEYKTYNSDGSLKESSSKYIDYDEIGNPVSYLGDTLTWFGRQLKTYKTADTTLSFTYGADGLRGTKTVTTDGNTVKSEFVYANGLLAYEKRGNSELFFFYDTYGHLTAIRYYEDATKTAYKQCYVVTNSMGDVLAFVDGDGNIIGSYEYDAWGNCKITSDNSSTNITQLNPIRYRGYYYDTETGLYYLQSRYYDPSIGRFINADTIDVLSVSPTELTDKNLFAYCDNNPVSRADNGGEVWHIVAGAAISGVGEIAGQLISGASFSEINWTNVGIATISGGITSACGPVLGAFISGTTNLIVDVIDGERDGRNLAKSFAVGAGASLIGSGAGKIVEKIGGKIAVNQLSKMSSREIKTTINSLYNISGANRNLAKNVSWVASEYSNLGSKLLGDTIPTAFGQFFECTSTLFATSFWR